jgi:hypothetical protein
MKSDEECSKKCNTLYAHRMILAIVFVVLQILSDKILGYLLQNSKLSISPDYRNTAVANSHTQCDAKSGLLIWRCLSRYHLSYVHSNMSTLNCISRASVICTLHEISLG